MSSPITLAATGLPNLATASFNPPTSPPVHHQHLHPDHRHPKHHRTKNTSRHRPIKLGILYYSPSPP